MYACRIGFLRAGAICTFHMLAPLAHDFIFRGASAYISRRPVRQYAPSYFIPHGRRLRAPGSDVSEYFSSQAPCTLVNKEGLPQSHPRISARSPGFALT